MYCTVSGCVGECVFAYFAWMCGCGVCECDLWECLCVNWRAVVLKDYPFVSIWPSGCRYIPTARTHAFTHARTHTAPVFPQCAKVLTRHTWNIFENTDNILSKLRLQLIDSLWFPGSVVCRIKAFGVELEGAQQTHPLILARPHITFIQRWRGDAQPPSPLKTTRLPPSLIQCEQ